MTAEHVAVVAAVAIVLLLLLLPFDVWRVS